MLTHDEVSGAVILAGRTDRGAVVLVAEFFRSGIVFGTRSYANIVRSIRRLFRRHTDWIAAGQCTQNVSPPKYTPPPSPVAVFPVMLPPFIVSEPSLSK